MSQQIRLLDTVAMPNDQPDAGLRRGQVETVVESLAPDAFAVEFSDDQGRTYTLESVNAAGLLPLVYEPIPL